MSTAFSADLVEYLVPNRNNEITKKMKITEAFMRCHVIRFPVNYRFSANLDYIPHIIRKLVTSCVLFVSWTHFTVIHLPIPPRVASLALTQSTKCIPRAFYFKFQWTFSSHELTLIPALVSNYIHYKMSGEIIHPNSNFNGCTVEAWECMSNFIPHFIGHVITYPLWN